MKVAAVQHDIVWEDRDATLARIEPLIAEAAAAGARLVALTEMFAVGFSMSADKVAESPDGPTTAWLLDQAHRHGVWVCGSAPVRASGEALPGNVLVVAAPDGALHRYAKIHPFSYAKEHEHYRAGTDFVTVDIEGVRTSLFVCYDLRFADEFWALAHDTDLYVVVANWPAARGHHWRSLLVARAIENQAYVLGVNRVGTADGLRYSGDSCVIDPMGEVLAAAVDVEAVVTADVDPATVAATRARFPFLADRR